MDLLGRIGMECGHHGGTADEPFLILRCCWQSEGYSHNKTEATALKPFDDVFTETVTQLHNKLTLWTIQVCRPSFVSFILPGKPYKELPKNIN